MRINKPMIKENNRTVDSTALYMKKTGKNSNIHKGPLLTFPKAAEILWLKNTKLT
jgi:hypothetical protein